MVVRKLKDCNTDHTPSGLTVDWITEQLDGSDLFEVRRVTIKVGGKSSHESHAHEHGVFVLSGEGVLIGDDGEHSLSKDSCAFVAGNETHQDRKSVV